MAAGTRPPRAASGACAPSAWSCRSAPSCGRSGEGQGCGRSGLLHPAEDQICSILRKISSAPSCERSGWGHGYACGKQYLGRIMPMQAAWVGGGCGGVAGVHVLAALPTHLLSCCLLASSPGLLLPPTQPPPSVPLGCSIHLPPSCAPCSNHLPPFSPPGLQQPPGDGEGGMGGQGGQPAQV